MADGSDLEEDDGLLRQGAPPPKPSTDWPTRPEDHNLQLERIRQRWLHQKQDLKRKEAELEEAGMEELSYQQQLEEELKRQKDELLLVNKKLQKYKARYQESKSVVEHMKEDHARLSKQLAEARSHSTAMEEKVRSLNASMHNLLEEKAGLIQKDSAMQLQLQGALGGHTVRLEEKQTQVEALEEHVRILKAQMEYTREEVERARAKAQTNEDRAIELQTKLDIASMGATSTKEMRSQVDTLEEQVMVLKYNCRRLVGLLQQCRIMGILPADTDIDEMAFLPANTGIADDGALVPVGHRDACPGKLALDRDFVPNRETDYWIPLDIFKLFSSFRKQHCPSVPLSACYELLVACNKVWKNKEVKAVQAAERLHKKAAADLRKKLQGKGHPDTNKANALIDTLRRELTQAKHKESYIGYAEHAKRLQIALHSTEEFKAKVEKLQRENDELRKKIHDLASTASRDQMQRWESGEQEGARRCWRIVDRTVQTLLPLCTDAMYCLGRATPDVLDVTVEIQQDFILRVQRELGQMREGVQSLTVHPA